MSFWLTDPELFLYAKGTGPDDVHLWRCNKPGSSSSSSLVVPMESDDFDYVSKVENYVDLIGDMFHWEEPDYKRLVKYINEKRLLVNSQGFVIAEVLHEADKDGNKKIDDANEEEEKDVPAIYIRSLDVLPLKPYIPMLRERPIPLRTVKYLGDVNGKAALMEVDSQVTKLTTRVENLEVGSTRLESKNNTLDTSVTKLTAGLATTTGNVSDLQSKNKVLEADNKTLEGIVTKLTADLVSQMNALTTLQQEVKNINANSKEPWMNDLTNSKWVGIEKLRNVGTQNGLTVVGRSGSFAGDYSSTNVQGSYWYKMSLTYGSTKYSYKAISLENLVPNKEKARFSFMDWFVVELEGKTYVYGEMP